MIVVCGEALFDVFPEADTERGLELSARIGGSPFNLAVGLARLGCAPMFFGGLSRDVFGQRLVQVLEAERVDVSAAARPDAQTPLVMVSLDSAGVPSYGFYGSGTAERSLVPADLDWVPLAAEVVHVGSYCLVSEPVAGTLRALVSRQMGRSLIACDLNVRLTIEPAVQAWRDALDWLLPRAGLLKVSDEDLHHLYPQLAPEDFVQRALEAGVRLVVVTRGADGVIAASAGGARVSVPAERVEVADTVGAGDSFQAALLFWLYGRGLLTRDGLGSLDGAKLRLALQFAGRAAAITCGRRGADLPRLTDLVQQ